MTGRGTPLTTPELNELAGLFQGLEPPGEPARWVGGGTLS